MELTIDNFSEFYSGVHGYPPFKWQERLLREVLEKGWPDAIDLPTGAGKTSVLDIAVFSLALQANCEKRNSPLRIALVVDRRIVVDGTFEHALKIAEALKNEKSDVLQAVAKALKSFGGDEALVVRRMRGGLAGRHEGTDSPLQPMLIASTVDQIGSRILHRGYGLSQNSQPIQAGLMGEDALIILDEAHCSQPFEETLKAVRKYRSLNDLGLPWNFVSMTATPDCSQGNNVFRLTESEKEEELLRIRIEASKVAKLLPLDVSEEKLPAEIAKEINNNNWISQGKFLLVIVNRVRNARALFQLLQKDSEKKNFTPILLFGRTRSLDRDRLIQEHMSAMRSGRRNDENQKALVVVATQCVEVGADLDADALITQVCPLDSLKQRFGRLNRLGSKENCRALIFASQKDQSVSEDDPVYGAALGNTWEWLKNHANNSEIGMGISELEALLPRENSEHEPSLYKEDISKLCTEKKHAPVLFPAHLDLLAATNPAPSYQTPVELFLHGLNAEPADIRLIWRKDLLADESDSWIETINECQPISAESMSISYLMAKIWLKKQGNDIRDLQKALDNSDKADSDIEGQKVGNTDVLKQKIDRIVAIGVVWRGLDSWILTSDRLNDIRPGDTIVIPAVAGGADRYGWTGNAIDIPSDLAEEAVLRSGFTPYLRITSSLNEQFWGTKVPDSWIKWSDYQQSDETEFDEEDIIENVKKLLPQWLESASNSEKENYIQESFVATLKAIVSGMDRGIVASLHPSGKGIIVALNKVKEECRACEISLSGHMKAVEKRATKYVNKLNLSDTVKNSVTEAAKLHDLGKADPRFQLILTGCNPLRINRSRPLAKSATQNKGFVRGLYEKVGLPTGFRHELLSSLMAEDHINQEKDKLDNNLTLHLIESHHGRCRPFAPSITDPSPVTIKFKFDGELYTLNPKQKSVSTCTNFSSRYEYCLNKYGWWGTSFLEALLRLADQKASENNEGANE